MEKLNESRALPGGMLNSKEHTEYEDWLEQLHKKIDKNKTEKDSCPMPLFDSEGSSNGCHNDDGSLIEDKKKKEKKLKIFESIYFDTLNLKELHDFKEALKNIVGYASRIKETLDDKDKIEKYAHELDLTVDGLRSTMDAIAAKKGLGLKKDLLQTWVSNFEEELAETNAFYQKYLDLDFISDKEKKETKEVFENYLDAWANEIRERLGGTTLSLLLKNMDGSGFNFNDWEDGESLLKLANRLQPSRSKAGVA